MLHQFRVFWLRMWTIQTKQISISIRDFNSKLISVSKQSSVESNQFESKMKPLVTSQRVLIWLCMCSSERIASQSKKLMYAIFGLISVLSTIVGLIAAVTFVYKYMFTSLELTLYVLMNVSGGAGLLYSWAVAFTARDKVNAIFERLSLIYDASKQWRLPCARPNTCSKTAPLIWNNFEFHFQFESLDGTPSSFQFLAEANAKSEKLWRICFKIMASWTLSTVVLSPLSVFLCWMFTGGFNTNLFYHPYIIMLVGVTSLGYSKCPKLELIWKHET